MNSGTQQKEQQFAKLQRYYRFHALIYDATRWTFLFGRGALLKQLSRLYTPTAILEVGCGTGRNLASLARHFPHASLTGIDLSADMIAKARTKLAPFGSRVTFIQAPYECNTDHRQRFDLVLFSYSLSMINPQWREILQQAHQDLKPGGVIAVVDFHRTAWSGYRNYMRLNHVRIEGEILPELERLFSRRYTKGGRGYGGIWEYFMYIGEK